MKRRPVWESNRYEVGKIEEYIYDADEEEDDDE